MITSAIHTGRLAVSRFLWATRLCRLTSIPLPAGVRMRFFPTSLSAGLWTDPTGHADEEQFILGQLRSGDTFIDVGANVGHLTLLAAQRVGPAGSVIAIEAHPRAFAFLRENVRLNNFKHVQLIHAAAGSRLGQTSISDFRCDDMNHVNPVRGKGIKVPLITLDSLGLDRRVALLKTDTEGFEPFVFEGARELLARVNCIYFECSEWNLNRYGRNSSELRGMLETAGFEICQVRANCLSPIKGSYDASSGGNLVGRRKA